MPRKKPPPEKRTQFDWKDAEAYRAAITSTVQRHLGKAFTNLPKDKIKQMLDYLLYSVGTVKAGIPGACMQGSRAKPAAAELDLIFRDTDDALTAVGVAHTTADTQKLAWAIASAIGLQGHGGRLGSLSEQARRAKHIEKRKLPDVTIEVTWPEGEVTIRGTPSPN